MMLRSVAPALGRDLVSMGLSSHRLTAPIIARVVRPWRTRGSRACSPGGPQVGYFSTYQPSTSRLVSSCDSDTGRYLTRLNSTTTTDTRSGLLYPGVSTGRVWGGSTRAFCTAYFSKPAVNVAARPSLTDPELPNQGLGLTPDEDSSEEADPELHPESDPWLLRHKIVTFNTDKLAERPQGVTFNVGYMDSGSDWHEDRKRVTPTILAIPGQPGSHEDMLPVVRALHEEQGHRVVIVNMPGYDFTKGLTAEDADFYDNSSTDLAEFVYHFTRELQLDRIDMVVTHSAGSIPLFIMMATSPVIKSAMVICTPSLHVPSRVSRPMWFIKGLVNTWNTPAGRAFLLWFLPKFNQVVGWLNTDDCGQLIVTAKFGANSNFKLMSSLAPKIASDKKPVVYVASKNDRLVELNLSQDWAALLGINKSQFDVYDEDYNLVKRADNEAQEEYPKGVLLAKGGHYPQRKVVALPTLVKEAKSLLAFVLNKNK